MSRFPCFFCGVLLLCASSGCRAKATDGECRGAIDRYLDLTTGDPPRSRDLPEAARGELRNAILLHRREDASYTNAVAQCTREMTRTEVECANTASNSAMWEGCIE